MQYLYAPWRGIYTGSTYTKKDTTSPFTHMFSASSDTEYFILTRLQHTAIVLNQYPYNPGHLMVIPYAQVAHLDDLTPVARYEMMEATTQSVRLLQDTIRNPGTNVGLNLGDKSSGGSILHHIHMHIIPRWHGDTSFLPIMAETKVLSEDLKTVYNTLLPVFREIDIPLPHV